MKLSEAFPSNYLKSADLQGREIPVIIADASMEMLGNERKLVLSFQGKKKTMVCNKTNAGRIAYLYGDDTDDWAGREIILYSEMVEYQGRTVEGLRVKAPAKKPAVQYSERKVNGMSVTTRAPDPIEEVTGSRTRDPAEADRRIRDGTSCGGQPSTGTPSPAACARTSRRRSR